MRKNLNTFISANNIFPANQHGFVKYRSVETNVLESLNFWTASLDKSKPVDVIYFDFAKAFDKVNHDLLIAKLRSVGIHEKIATWLQNFIKDRSFQVRKNSSYSEVFPVPNGVPQGGCLSPLLFNIFTSEIPQLISACGVNCRMFADDVKIFSEINCYSDKVNLQKAIDTLVTWSKTWGLPLSHPKTKILYLGANNLKYNYTIESSPITAVEDCIRDLGFHFDSKLSLQTHAKIVAAKAKFRTFNLFRTIKTRDQDTWVRIYTTYIRPIAEFGPTIINGYPSVSKLYESIQNDFTRKLFMRCGAPNYRAIPSPEIRNQTLGLDSLKLRRDIADIKMVTKILSPNSLIDISQFFTLRPSRTRGQPFKISYSRARGRLRANFFTCRAGSKYLYYSKQKTIPKSSSAVNKFIKKYK